jgi:hypothetical protein
MSRQSSGGDICMKSSHLIGPAEPERGPLHVLYTNASPADDLHAGIQHPQSPLRCPLQTAWILSLVYDAVPDHVTTNDEYLSPLPLTRRSMP